VPTPANPHCSHAPDSKNVSTPKKSKRRVCRNRLHCAPRQSLVEQQLRRSMLKTPVWRSQHALATGGPPCVRFRSDEISQLLRSSEGRGQTPSRERRESRGFRPIPDLGRASLTPLSHGSTTSENRRAVRELPPSDRKRRRRPPPIRRRGGGGRVSRPVRGRARLPRRQASARAEKGSPFGLRAMPALRWKLHRLSTLCGTYFANPITV